MRLDGERLPLGGPRQRAVLARLLVDAERVVAADALVEDVWAGTPPATATKTLQRYVWQLRRTLGPGVIETQGRGYRLGAGGDGIDARRFERLLARAGEFSARGGHAQATELWREALGLWRGEVLADLVDLPCTAAERARLGELRLAALERCLEGEIGLGRAPEVAAEAADLVEEHPLRQRLWVVLMTALTSSGRPVDALRAFERHRKLLAEELGLEPSAELRDLERRILSGDDLLTTDAGTDPISPVSMPVVPKGLPTTPTSFVGRTEHLAGIDAALAANRLVTLVGPAGIGKTRLATEVAARLVDRRAVCFVDLASRHEGDAVTHAVAAALGVEEQPGTALADTLMAVLAHRAGGVLVLDNCEHLLEPAAAFAAAVLDRCPAVSMLATSRHVLGLDAETIWPVPPLGDEAVELFADRARRAAPASGFELTPESRVVVADLCRRLDGLPLAIELAAGQVRALEPGELADRLDDRLRLLARPRGTTGGTVPRQRTLRATIAWSHDLLDPGARLTLARLGVFPGSFTLEAAEAVCVGPDVVRSDVLGHITELVDHSLLVREPGPASVARYRLLETIRIFAGEQLDVLGEQQARKAAHARCYLDLARRADPHFYGPDERRWRERLRDEDHNFDAALRWARDHDAALSAELAVALWFYWDATWRESAAVEFLAPLLEPHRALPSALRGWALTVAGVLGSHQGDVRQPLRWAEQAVEAFTELGDGVGLAWAEHVVGAVLTNEGSLDRAEPVLCRALDGFRRLGDERAIGLTINLLGTLELRRSDYVAAERWHHEGLALWRRRGSRLGQGTALRRLAVCRLHRGDLAAAAEACSQAGAMFRSLDDATSVAHVMSTEGDIARVGGDDETAVERYGAAMDGFHSIGDRRCIASTYKNLATLAAQRRDHDEARELFHRALSLRRELGDVAGLAECIEGLAATAIDQGDTRQATALLAMASVIRRTTGT